MKEQQCENERKISVNSVVTHNDTGVNIDVNVKTITPLESPDQMRERIPATSKIEHTVSDGRAQIREIIHGRSDRFLVIVGPCSIHDVDVALDYGERLARLAEKTKETLYIAMRTYFEKPRTTIGWKGFINDPYLNGTFDVSAGLERARELLIELTDMGLPTATEWLDPLTPQYLGDLISWGAIGSRTTESQSHRQLASGLSSPVGFKNGTGGSEHSVRIAADGVTAASAPHAFLGANHEGKTAVIITKGNPDCHIIMRGGIAGSNYKEESIKKAQTLLAKLKLETNLAVDCSHGNSNKDHKRQPLVFRDVLKQRAQGNRGIVAVMLESNINEGNQPLSSSLEYGVSITDACIGWDDTEALLLEAAELLS